MLLANNLKVYHIAGCGERYKYNLVIVSCESLALGGDAGDLNLLNQRQGLFLACQNK
jgi:hypothetical protein